MPTIPFTLRWVAGIAGLLCSTFLLAIYICAHVTDKSTVLAAGQLPAISGIAWLADDAYVVIHDSCESVAGAGPLADRLGICTVAPRCKVRFTPLKLNVALATPPATSPKVRVGFSDRL